MRPTGVIALVGEESESTSPFQLAEYHKSGSWSVLPMCSPMLEAASHQPCFQAPFWAILAKFLRLHEAKHQRRLLSPLTTDSVGILSWPSKWEHYLSASDESESAEPHFEHIWTGFWAHVGIASYQKRSFILGALHFMVSREMALPPTCLETHGLSTWNNFYTEHGNRS